MVGVWWSFPIFENHPLTLEHVRNYRLLAILLVTLSPFLLFSQQNALSTYYSIGSIPQQLLGKATSRAERRIGGLPETAGDVKKQFIFFDENRFQNYINSGRITFGDTVSEHANELLRILTEQYPFENRVPRILLYHSIDPAPLTFSNDIILLSSALLATVENDDQLAFIIARELVNLRENFAFTRFNQLLTLNGELREKAVNIFHQNTKEQNLRADQKAHTIIKDAGFLVHEATQSLKILLTPDILFKQQSFSPVFFERSGYLFPESFYELPSENPEIDLDVEETRTDRLQRFDILQATFPKIEAPSKTNAFLFFKELCFDDLCNIYLIEREYPEALYLHFLALSTNDKNIVSQAIITKILYNLCIYSTEFSVGKIPDQRSIKELDALDETFNNYDNSSATYYYREFSSYPGFSQQLARFLCSLRDEELIVLTIDQHTTLLANSPLDRDGTSGRIQLLLLQLQLKFTAIYWEYVYKIQKVNPDLIVDSTTVELRCIDLGKSIFNQTVYDRYTNQKKHDIRDLSTLRRYCLTENNQIISDSTNKKYYYKAIRTLNLDSAFSKNFVPVDLKKDSLTYDFLLNLLFPSVFTSNSGNYSTAILMPTYTRSFSFKTGIDYSYQTIYKRGKEIKKRVKTNVIKQNYNSSRSTFLATRLDSLTRSDSFPIALVNVSPDQTDFITNEEYNQFCFSQLIDDDNSSLAYSSMLCRIAFPGLVDSSLAILGTPYILRVGIIEFNPLINDQITAPASRCFVVLKNYNRREISGIYISDKLHLFTPTDYIALQKELQTILATLSLRNKK